MAQVPQDPAPQQPLECENCHDSITKSKLYRCDECLNNLNPGPNQRKDVRLLCMECGIVSHKNMKHPFARILDHDEKNGTAENHKENLSLAISEYLSKKDLDTYRNVADLLTTTGVSGYGYSAGKAAMQAAKEAAEEAAKKAAEEAGKEVAKEAGKEVAKEAGKEVAKEAGKEVSKEAGKEVSKEAGKEVSKESAKGTSLSVYGAGLEAGLEAVGQSSLQSVAWYNLGAATVVFAVEMGILCFKYTTNQVSAEEGRRLVLKSFACNASSGAASTGGFAAGAAFGAAISGPVGAGVGAILGGMAAGFTAQFFVARLIDKWLPNSAKRSEDTAIEEARKRFNFTSSDIKNPNIFNKKEVKARYRSRALECHPDKLQNVSDEERMEKEASFVDLNAAYGVLLALLDPQLRNQKDLINEILAVHL